MKMNGEGYVDKSCVFCGRDKSRVLIFGTLDKDEKIPFVYPSEWNKDFVEINALKNNDELLFCCESCAERLNKVINQIVKKTKEVILEEDSKLEVEFFEE